MGDAARSRAELQDLRVVGHLPVDELRLVGGAEEPVQLDGGARISHRASLTDAREGD